MVEKSPEMNEYLEIFERYAHAPFNGIWLPSGWKLSEPEVELLTSIWVIRDEGVQRTWDFVDTPENKRKERLDGNPKRIRREDPDFWNSCVHVFLYESRLGGTLVDKDPLELRDKDIEYVKDSSGLYLPDDTEISLLQLYLTSAEIGTTYFADQVPKFKRFDLARTMVNDFYFIHAMAMAIKQSMVESRHLKLC